jgi:hypothetical protein
MRILDDISRISDRNFHHQMIEESKSVAVKDREKGRHVGIGEDDWSTLGYPALSQQQADGLTGGTSRL